MVVVSRTAIHGAQHGATYEVDHDLAVTSCGVCHVVFAMPASLERKARAHPADDPDTVYFHCPHGHQLRYNGESKEQKLERQLGWARDDAARANARADQSAASARGQKAAATRARNERDRILRRIKNGVCPCCNRSFQNVRRHMASQHPEFEIPPKEADE